MTPKKGVTTVSIQKCNFAFARIRQLEDLKVEQPLISRLELPRSPSWWGAGLLAAPP